MTLAMLQAQAREVNRLTSATVEALTTAPEALIPGTPAFARIASRAVPRWHFAMLNDAERNDALTTALEQQVPRGAYVLDIGTGTGMLAMCAVRAGAGRVVTCEENPLIAEIARQVIAEQGMSDRITVVGKRSTEVAVGRELDRPADVIVSEIVDCGLIGEGLLPTVRHARAHLLAPDGVMIPRAGRLYAHLVQSDAVMGLNQAHHAAGFDVSLMNVTSTYGHFPVRLHTWPHERLSAPVCLLDLDLDHDPLEPGSRKLTVPVTGAGTAHALAAWFELDLGAGVVLRNSPDNFGSHWMQALIPFDTPVEVTAGDEVDVQLQWTDTVLTGRLS